MAETKVFDIVAESTDLLTKDQRLFFRMLNEFLVDAGIDADTFTKAWGNHFTEQSNNLGNNILQNLLQVFPSCRPFYEKFTDLVDEKGAGIEPQELLKLVRDNGVSLPLAKQFLEISALAQRDVIARYHEVSGAMTSGMMQDLALGKSGRRMPFPAEWTGEDIPFTYRNYIKDPKHVPLGEAEKNDKDLRLHFPTIHELLWNSLEATLRELGTRTRIVTHDIGKLKETLNQCFAAQRSFQIDDSLAPKQKEVFRLLNRFAKTLPQGSGGVEQIAAAISDNIDALLHRYINGPLIQAWENFFPQMKAYNREMDRLEKLYESGDKSVVEMINGLVRNKLGLDKKPSKEASLTARSAWNPDSLSSKGAIAKQAAKNLVAHSRMAVLGNPAEFKEEAKKAISGVALANLDLTAKILEPAQQAYKDATAKVRGAYADVTRSLHNGLLQDIAAANNRTFAAIHQSGRSVTFSESAGGKKKGGKGEKQSVTLKLPSPAEMVRDATILLMEQCAAEKHELQGAFAAAWDAALQEKPRPASVIEKVTAPAAAIPTKREEMPPTPAIEVGPIAPHKDLSRSQLETTRAVFARTDPATYDQDTARRATVIAKQINALVGGLTRKGTFQAADESGNMYEVVDLLGKPIIPEYDSLPNLDSNGVLAEIPINWCFQQEGSAEGSITASTFKSLGGLVAYEENGVGVESSVDERWEKKLKDALLADMTLKLIEPAMNPATLSTGEALPEVESPGKKNKSKKSKTEPSDPPVDSQFITHGRNVIDLIKKATSGRPEITETLQSAPLLVAAAVGQQQALKNVGGSLQPPIHPAEPHKLLARVAMLHEALISGTPEDIEKTQSALDQLVVKIMNAIGARRAASTPHLVER